MKEKLRNFVVAAQIVSQLPAGETKSKAVEELFGKSLAEVGLPGGSYVYRKVDMGNGAHSYQFVFSDNDCDVVINANIGGEKETFTIVADIS